MKKEVKIAEFKARLSEYLRAVRRGHEIVVKDRDTPIARIVPYQAPANRLMVRPATKSLKEVEKLFASLPPPKNLKPEDLEEALREVRRDVFDRGLV